MPFRNLIGALGTPGESALTNDIARVPDLLRTLRADYADLRRYASAAAPVGQAATEAMRANVDAQRALLDYDAAWGEIVRDVAPNVYRQNAESAPTESNRPQWWPQGVGCSAHGSRGLAGVGLLALVWCAIIVGASIVAAVVAAVTARALEKRAIAYAVADRNVEAYSRYLDMRREHPEIDVAPPIPTQIPGDSPLLSVGNGLPLGLLALGGLVAWLAFGRKGRAA